MSDLRTADEKRAALNEALAKTMPWDPVLGEWVVPTSADGWADILLELCGREVTDEYVTRLEAQGEDAGWVRDAIQRVFGKDTDHG